MRLIFLIFYVILFFLLGNISCRKLNPPRAIIIVKDTSYKPVDRADVIIYVKAVGGYVDPKQRVEYFSKKTNDLGKAEFEFKNEAILNVIAKKGFPEKKGEGLIYLKFNEVIEKTIIIK